MFKTIFLIICVLVILAFVGVEPLSSYKNNGLSTIGTWLGQANQPSQPARTQAKPAQTPTQTQAETVIKFPVLAKGDRVIIPDVLVMKADGSFVEHATGKSVESNDALQMIRDWQDKEQKKPTQIEAERQKQIQGEIAKLPIITSSIPPLSPDYPDIFNQYRRSNRLPALSFTPELNNLAQIRAKEIQLDFSHAGLDKYGNLGENIALGVFSSRNAFEAWRNSPGHNANMLYSEYKITGYYRDGGYAVQVFQ